MKKIKKYSIINFICVIILSASKISQTYIFDTNNYIDRKASMLIGLFITVPVFGLAIISFIQAILLHKKNKEKFILKENLFLIPFVLLIIFMVIILITIFIKSWQHPKLTLL